MGIRIIKTAVAVVLAIYLAQYLGLHSPYSTGLLAILGVDVTRRKGVRTSLQRIAASFLGLLIAAYLFWLIGFHVWVIGIYILILFPILARFQLKEGVVTGSVVMFHVFAEKQISSGLILNEIALLLVGLGTATLINIIYMPREDRQLLDLRERLETCFSHIFKEISNHLRDNRYIWSGRELLESNDILEQAMNAVKRSKENALFQGDTLWAGYFYMRKQQMDSVDRMVQYVAQVYQTLPHGELLASVFDEISEDVKVAHYTGRSEKKLELLEKEFQEMPLPSSREEFEIRSALLQLMVELKSYLAVAKREKKQMEPAAYADSE
ncbi:aromatic acid exporter family protein [Paenibacillus sp. LMG 31456]|uniref:Aromatic acid exporter family protein n=1 Tax=Paenibacillus foliorum TaxID=2654974 RepID=A0A972H1Q6_9BACL|nr:aromatic acid exporter family protein [Paenibacillus foliorum]NOU96990.1 aromatic acid exporter family protein [Paenibacillus foliorum]